MHRQKGSITIFALLSMLLVMSTLFSMLELARYQMIKGLAQLQTDIALEGAFANYSSILWEQYHLLACQESQVEEHITSAGQSRLDDLGLQYNLLLFCNKKAELIGYIRLTDEEGAAYMQAVSTYMERNVIYETAKQIYNQYEAVKTLKENSLLDLENVDKALEEIEKEKERQQESKKDVKKSVSVGSSKESKVLGENPLEEFQTLKKTGILKLVLEDTEELSTATLSKENAVSGRKLKEGTGHIQPEEADWLDRIWMQQYLLTYFSYYGQELEGHHLAYELEYLLGGKESDLENLQAVATEILLFRTVCNFLYLMSDVEKVEEATILATVLAGGNLAIVEVIKVGLLTAWAFAEGILDVRALFQNKKIPLIKTAEIWSLELANIGTVMKENYAAKESEQGLLYVNYLGLLLLFSSDEDISMRSMDVQEATIQTLCGDKTFRLDELLIQAEVEITYGYKPIFACVEENYGAKAWQYEISCQRKYGY